MRKNNLDEMQEQKLLKIEHNGVWLSFWGLFAAIVIQGCMRVPFRQMAGEWIVFMALAFYICIGCIKAGIWDRRLKPTLKTNTVLSLIAGVGAGLVFATRSYPISKDIRLFAVTAAIGALVVFILTFATLQLSSHLYKNRIRHLEQKCEGSGNINDGSSH